MGGGGTNCYCLCVWYKGIVIDGWGGVYGQMEVFFGVYAKFA